MGLHKPHNSIFINTLRSQSGKNGTNGTVFYKFFVLSLFYQILIPFFQSHFVPFSLFQFHLVPICSVLVLLVSNIKNSMTGKVTVKIKSKLLFNNNLIWFFTEMTEIKAIFLKNLNNSIINQYLKIKMYKKNCQNFHILTARLSKLNLPYLFNLWKIFNYQ